MGTPGVLTGSPQKWPWGVPHGHFQRAPFRPKGTHNGRNVHTNAHAVHCYAAYGNTPCLRAHECTAGVWEHLWAPPPPTHQDVVGSRGGKKDQSDLSRGRIWTPPQPWGTSGGPSGRPYDHHMGGMCIRMHMQCSVTRHMGVRRACVHTDALLVVCNTLGVRMHTGCHHIPPGRWSTC